MRIFVGVTDGSWFRHLAAQPNLGEVNFWRPSDQDFKALGTGGLFLFKILPRSVPGSGQSCPLR
jgi:putative restriction endonuclease